MSKTSSRIKAYGAIDELNSVIGLAIAGSVDDQTSRRLQAIQNDLFDIGADLCVPETDEDTADSPSRLRVTAEQVATLENWIDDVNERLEPLSSFVLPGGTLSAGSLHLARTVCRRTEITVLELAAEEPVNPQVAIYLNRLSDLFFVFARAANDNGKSDILWQPGKNRNTE